MGKAKQVDSLNQKISALEAQQQELDGKIKVCSDKIGKVVALSEAKKSGNVALIIGVIAIIAEIILLCVGFKFRLLDIGIIGIFLITGVVRKTKGIKEAKSLSEELKDVDIDKENAEESRLLKEKEAIEQEIASLKEKIKELLIYDGKNWDLLNIDTNDRATVMSLEKDLRDLVDIILLSNEKWFLCDNWLINTIMLYMTAQLAKDTNKLNRYDTVLRNLRNEKSWPLTFLGTMVLVGDIKMLLLTGGSPDTENWETSRKKANVPEPTGDDAVFYQKATAAVDKIVKIASKQLSA